MRRTGLCFGFLLLASSPLACGSAPPPEAKPPAAVAAPAAAAPAPAAVAAPEVKPLDLSPVPEPEAMIGLARWKDPQTTLQSISGTAGLPPELVSAGSEAVVEEILKEALRGVVDARQLAPVIALDAPVDAIASLDPNPSKRDGYGAIAIGLKSFDGARQAAEASGPVVEVAPGMLRLGDKRRMKGACVIAASAGKTPARLVCGARDRDVMTLAPYLTRTLPTLASGSADMHAELRVTPFDQRFGALLRQTLAGAPMYVQSELSIGEPKFDRALVEAATGLADELSLTVSDLDKVALDLSFSPTGGFTTSGSLAFRGTKSWLATVITDKPAKTGAPALFWRLPKDADLATFAPGPDPAHYATMLRTLRTLLDGVLTKENIGTAADRRALAELLAMPLPKGTISVQAQGRLPDAKSKAKSVAQQRLDGLLDAYLGWTLLGVDQPPAAIVKQWKDLVAAYNRPGLQSAMKDALGSDAKLLPTLKTVAAPAQLGAGGLAVELKVRDLPAEELSGLMEGIPSEKAKLNASLYVFVMGDGPVTWMGVGANKDALVKRLLSVKAGAPEGATLATRAGLEPLRSTAHWSGGFVSLGSMTGGLTSVMETLPEAAVPEARKLLDALRRMPNRGETPMLLTSGVAGSGPVVASTSFNVPRGTIEDIAALVLAVAKP